MYLSSNEAWLLSFLYIYTHTRYVCVCFARGLADRGYLPARAVRLPRRRAAARLGRQNTECKILCEIGSFIEKNKGGASNSSILFFLFSLLLCSDESVGLKTKARSKREEDRNAEFLALSTLALSLSQIGLCFFSPLIPLPLVDRHFLKQMIVVADD